MGCKLKFAHCGHMCHGLILTSLKSMFPIKKNLRFRNFHICFGFWGLIFWNLSLYLCPKWLLHRNHLKRLRDKGLNDSTKMSATQWLKLENYATLMLMPIFLLYSCCPHCCCVYTCTAFNYDSTVDSLADQSITSIQRTPHTHQTHTKHHTHT